MSLQQDRTADMSPVSSKDQENFHNEPVWPSGWQPWRALKGCFLLMFNSWGIVNAYGTYQSYYAQHLFVSTPVHWISLIGATQTCVVLSLSFIVGRLLDADAKYSRYLTACGGILVTLGHLLLSVVNGSGGRDEGNYFATLATQGLMVGLGQACFFVSSSQIVGTWFPKRKSVVMGIVASGASIAGLVYPIMIKFLITKVGFIDAVRYKAAVIGFTSLLAFFLAVPNPNHRYRKPEKWCKTSVWIDTNAFRSASFNWFTAAICFVFFGFYAVFFNLEDWAAHNGFAKKDIPPGFGVELGPGGQREVDNDAIRTFWLTCIMNVSSTAGRIFSGCFAERFGALNIHSIATAIGALLLLLLWTFATKLVFALCFVIVFGAVSGAIIGLPPASMAHILGRSDPAQQAKLGHWTGMMYTIASLFGLSGPPIASYLIQAYGPNNYLTVQVWSGSCLIMASICMVMAIYKAGPSKMADAIKGMKLALSRTPSLDKEGDDTAKTSWWRRGTQRSASGSGVEMPVFPTRDANPEMETV